MLYLPNTLPSEPAEYHKLGAGTDRRWWRVLLGFLLLVALGFVLTLIVQLIPVLFYNPTTYLSEVSKLQNGSVDLNHPGMFVVTMVSLIVLIPAAVLATVVGLRIRPGYLFSVAGKIRWSWLARCVLLASLVFVPLMLVSTFVLESTTLAPVHNLGWALILVMALVPLQSAAEEIVFRGYLAQTVGALVKPRFLSLALATILSFALFAAAHGSFHPSTFAGLGMMALFAMLLTWYTGGLEGAIAIHAVNNVTIFILAALTGPMDSLVNSSTDIGWAGLAIMFAMDGTASALIAWSAKRRGIVRYHDPKRNPTPDLAYLAAEHKRGRIYPQYQHLYPARVQAQLWGTPPPAATNPVCEEGPHEF